MMAEGLADDFDVPDLIDGIEAIALKNTEIDEQWWTDFLKELPSTAKYERNNAIQPGALKTGDGTLVKRVSENLRSKRLRQKRRTKLTKLKRTPHLNALCGNYLSKFVVMAIKEHLKGLVSL